MVFFNILLPSITEGSLATESVGEYTQRYFSNFKRIYQFAAPDSATTL